jgi:hypothetical protein
MSYLPCRGARKRLPLLFSDDAQDQEVRRARFGPGLWPGVPQLGRLARTITTWRDEFFAYFSTGKANIAVGLAFGGLSGSAVTGWLSTAAGLVDSAGPRADLQSATRCSAVSRVVPFTANSVDYAYACHLSRGCRSTCDNTVTRSITMHWRHRSTLSDAEATGEHESGHATRCG